MPKAEQNTLLVLGEGKPKGREAILAGPLVNYLVIQPRDCARPARVVFDLLRVDNCVQVVRQLSARPPSMLHRKTFRRGDI